MDLGGLTGGGTTETKKEPEKEEAEGEEGEEGDEGVTLDADYDEGIHNEYIDEQFLSIARYLENTTSVPMYEEYVATRPWSVALSDIVFHNEGVSRGNVFLAVSFRNNKAKLGPFSFCKSKLVCLPSPAELTESQFLTAVVRNLASSEVGDFGRTSVSPPNNSRLGTQFRLSYKQLADWSMRVEIWEEKGLGPNKLLGFHTFPFPGLARNSPQRSRMFWKLGSGADKPLGALEFRMTFEQTTLNQEITLTNWSLGLAHDVLERGAKGSCRCIVFGLCRGARSCSSGFCNCCRETVEVTITMGGTSGSLSYWGEVRSSTESVDDLSDKFHFIRLRQRRRLLSKNSFIFTGSRTQAEQRFLHMSFRLKTKRSCADIVAHAKVPLMGVTAGAVLPVSAPVIFQQGCCGHNYIGGVVRGNLQYRIRKSFLSRVFEQPFGQGGVREVLPFVPPPCKTRTRRADRAYLNITVKKVTDLVSVRPDGRADARVTVLWAGMRMSTTTIVSSVSPRFGQRLEFPLPELPGDTRTPHQMRWAQLSAALEALGEVVVEVWDDPSAAPVNTEEAPRMGNPSSLLAFTRLKLPFERILQVPPVLRQKTTKCPDCCFSTCCHVSCKGCIHIRKQYRDAAPTEWSETVLLSVPGKGDAHGTRLHLSVVLAGVNKERTNRLVAKGKEEPPPNMHLSKLGPPGVGLDPATPDWLARPTRSNIAQLAHLTFHAEIPEWWRNIATRYVNDQSRVNALLVCKDAAHALSREEEYRIMPYFATPLDARQQLGDRYLFGDGLLVKQERESFLDPSAPDDEVERHLVWRAAQAVAAIEYSFSDDVVGFLEVLRAHGGTGGTVMTSATNYSAVQLLEAGGDVIGVPEPDDSAKAAAVTGASKSDDETTAPGAGAAAGSDDDDGGSSFGEESRFLLERNVLGPADESHPYYFLASFRPSVMMSPDRFLTTRRGGTAEHACLLVSLINGLELKTMTAFVVVGTALKPDDTAAGGEEEEEEEEEDPAETVDGDTVDSLVEDRAFPLQPPLGVEYEFEDVSEDNSTLGADSSRSPSVSSEEDGRLNDIELEEFATAGAGAGSVGEAKEPEPPARPSKFGMQDLAAQRPKDGFRSEGVFRGEVLHYWVVTVATTKEGSVGQVTYYDGARMLDATTLPSESAALASDTKGEGVLCRVLMVFNHRNVWVNCQEDTSDPKLTSKPVHVSTTNWDLTNEEEWRQAFKLDLPLRDRPADSVRPYGEEVWPAGIRPFLGRDVSFYELDVLGDAVSREVQAGIETFRRSLALGPGNKTGSLPYVAAQLGNVLRLREQCDSYSEESDAGKLARAAYRRELGIAQQVFRGDNAKANLGFRFRVWRVNTAAPSRVQQVVVGEDLSWTSSDEMFVVAARVQQLFTGVFVTRVAIMSAFPRPV